MNTSMLEVAEAYAVGEAATVARVCVHDGQVRSFSDGVSRFLRQLGQDATDEYWAPVIRRLRRVRWELATTPLPSNHPAFSLSESATFVSRSLRACDRIYPAHADAGRSLSDRLTELAASEGNPLGLAITQLLSHPADHLGDVAAFAIRQLSPRPEAGLVKPPFATATAVVLRHSRHAGAVKDHLRAAGFPVTVLTASQLAQPNVYGRAVLVGAVAWYPSFAVTAPRALRIHVVQYGWIRDRTEDRSIFSGSESRPPALPPLELPPGTESGGTETGYDADEVLPPTDWSAIGARARPPEESALAQPELVSAYLLLLASDQAVFLEAEEGSRAYVVELGGEKELRQVSTRSIDPGTYLVIREGGEGDYIPAIADSLLGANAQELRAAQRRWKSRLQELIDCRGLDHVLGCLKEEGAVRATDMNVRRWASDASIRTQDYRDFHAIMRVVGLDGEAEQLWQKMALIDRAHLRAGQRVRALLESEILTADTRELERRGWMDYDVPEIEGEGALRVARVADRAPETVLVPTRTTRHAFPVDRDLWQG
jgi:hypothetical protein